MAYPLEQEHKEYMDYVLEEQENGRKPLPKDKWRETIKNSKAQEVMPSALRGDA